MNLPSSDLTFTQEVHPVTVETPADENGSPQVVHEYLCAMRMFLFISCARDTMSCARVTTVATINFTLSYIKTLSISRSLVWST